MKTSRISDSVANFNTCIVLVQMFVEKVNQSVLSMFLAPSKPLAISETNVSVNLRNTAVVSMSRALYRAKSFSRLSCFSGAY